MPTPTTTISLSHVNIELGNSSNAQISMNDSAVRELAGVGASGTISMDNLRGKSHATTTYASLRIEPRYQLTSAAMTTAGSNSFIDFGCYEFKIYIEGDASIGSYYATLSNMRYSGWGHGGAHAYFFDDNNSTFGKIRGRAGYESSEPIISVDFEIPPETTRFRVVQNTNWESDSFKNNFKLLWIRVVIQGTDSMSSINSGQAIGVTAINPGGGTTAEGWWTGDNNSVGIPADPDRNIYWIYPN